MNINNFKSVSAPSVKTRLKALSLAIAMTTSLAGCSSSDVDIDVLDETQIEQTHNDYEGIKKVFDVGEHIISVPIKDPTIGNRQYDYYDGYKCVGIATSSYGEHFKDFGGACILYTNEYPVECYSFFDEGTEHIYNEFGTPLGYEKKDNNVDNDGTKDFGIGEHIISVPIKDPRNYTIQHIGYDGYEAVGIAISSYGKSDVLSNWYGGGAILYVNTEPVRCEISYYEGEKGCYASFGTPIVLEDNKTKILS